MVPRIVHLLLPPLLMGVVVGIPGERRQEAPTRPEPAIGLLADSTANAHGREVPELFSADGAIRFVLSADFGQLHRDRDQDSEERPGTVTVSGRDGGSVEIPVQVKTRGRFRLQDEICSDPPLRLDFPEPLSAGTPFDGQDKLKLVTHCRDSDEFEQNLLEEYLAYRIYNQLTELSFRVRLARITYVDTGGGRGPVERVGFLIEDEDALGRRLGGEVIEVPGIYPNEFALDQIGLLYLFHFMIGNVDWGTGSGHNVKILLRDGEYHPLPYDFDFSGLVDAPYAHPSELSAPLHDSVRERIYWGVCMPGIDHEGLFARFSEKREKTLALVQSQLGLSEANQASAVGYLEDFYRILADPERAGREIVNACRPWL